MYRNTMEDHLQIVTNSTDDHRVPYIRELFRYECDGSGGVFEFNGYFYVEDHELPKTYELYHTKTENTEIVQHNEFIIEIYRREEIADTSVYTPTRKELEARGEETTDEDDEWGGICFFPTKRQILYFRVI